ncbi:hypothetical protein LCGC14_1613280 [marine sediment metagenome]|uniref:Uncharacterized protein n=1 Tax=marine sediment metagenome TaxID=412755 RepID=A0A0F9KNE4_9ZZZZ
MNDLQTTDDCALLEPPKSLTLIPADADIVAALMDVAKYEQLKLVAGMYANSSLVPQSFAKNVPNCTIALTLAIPWKMNPLMVMQKIYFVHNKPSLEAQLIIAVANNSKLFDGGIKFELSGSGDTLACRAWAILSDGGDIVESTVSVAMAKAAGWWTKKDSWWPKMPEQMLKYRSATFLIRTTCPELLMGCPEKSEAQEMSGEGHGDTLESPQSRITMVVPPEASSTPPQPPEAPDEPVSEPPEPEADAPPDRSGREMSQREKYLIYVDEAGTDEELDQLMVAAESGDMLPGDLEIVGKAIEKRKEYLSRGERSNG